VNVNVTPCARETPELGLRRLPPAGSRSLDRAFRRRSTGRDDVTEPSPKPRAQPDAAITRSTNGQLVDEDNAHAAFYARVYVDV
jgi:hypothetical protein